MSLLSLIHVPKLKLAPVHLPLGISFFTFHALSYVIDIHRRKSQGGKPLDFALYMTLFPHSIAGPIVRYGDIAGQLAHRVVTTAGFAEGDQAVHHRAGQENAGGQHGRGRGRCHLHAAGQRAQFQPGLAGSRLLHAANLL